MLLTITPTKPSYTVDRDGQHDKLSARGYAYGSVCLTHTSLFSIFKLYTDVKRPYREPFISGSDINFTAHHVGWIIAGFFGRTSGSSSRYVWMQADLLHLPSYWLGGQRMADQEAPRILYEANAAALYRSDSVYGSVLCGIFLVLILLVRRVDVTTLKLI